MLILVPAGLVDQWRQELDRKFALPSVVLTRGRSLPASGGAGEEPVVIASIASARRDPLQAEITSQPWDLVIVDEAHRVKNPRSASGRLVRSLHSQYLLLLTATPVENRLGDLFQLVNLVRPGHLGTPRQFQDRHGRAPGSEPARDLPALQTRLRDVMVRHRRSEVALMLPRRLAQTLRVAPNADEADLYRLVSARVRAEGRAASSSRALTLRTVQRLAGSSPAALAPALAKVGWDDLAGQAGRVGATQKARALVEHLGRHQADGDKAIVFCAYRATLQFLARLLDEAGLSAVTYHGSLTRREKEAAIHAFEAEVPVLLTTEAAGEGRNLQFCHVMINFDLPWNPMQIEQRLGRIHRIGQDHDVHLTNLATRGTIEEQILRVLESKINLFELVVGELDMILGRVTDEFDFESAVYTTHVTSSDDEEFSARLEALGDELAQARVEYLTSRERTDRLVGDEAGREAAGGGRGPGREAS